MHRVELSLFDLTMCVSDAMDMVSPTVVDHHKKVAFIAVAMGKEMQLDQKDLMELLLASLLHDSGALSLRERLNALDFEIENPHKHAELGYLMLKDFPFYEEVAEMIRFHHVNWAEEHKFASGSSKGAIPYGSRIIHLADRVSVLIKDDSYILNQADDIKQKIEMERGHMFDPELLDVLYQASAREAFWLDAVSPYLDSHLVSYVGKSYLKLGMNELLEIANLFRKVIDFRSAFTTTHSMGVATTATMLAEIVGFSETECKMIKTAGYLHDLGKLAIPREILEKPGKLTGEEFRLIKSHTYYTYRTLERLPQLETINQWGAYHHERLNGYGYPFCLTKEELPLGSRIMAVADIFTALTEDRPYRQGMKPTKVIDILEKMVENGTVDLKVVAALKENLQKVNEARIEAQRISHDEYEDLEIEKKENAK